MPTIPLNGTDDPTPNGGAPSVELPTREPRQRAPNDRKLALSLAETYQTIGAVGFGFAQVKQDEGLAHTSARVIENAEAIAEAWMDLADKNPKVKSALKGLTEVSSIGVLAGLHFTCALPFLISRGIGGPIVASMDTTGGTPE
jgi:hypothetical protein